MCPRAHGVSEQPQEKADLCLSVDSLPLLFPNHHLSGLLFGMSCPISPDGCGSLDLVHSSSVLLPYVDGRDWAGTGAAPGTHSPGTPDRHSLVAHCLNMLLSSCRL